MGITGPIFYFSLAIQAIVELRFLANIRMALATSTMLTEALPSGIGFTAYPLVSYSDLVILRSAFYCEQLGIKKNYAPCISGVLQYLYPLTQTNRHLFVIPPIP
jgi:hypothetical protein